MTVILSDSHAEAQHAPKAKPNRCDFCGRHLSYPFVWWRMHERTLSACGPCCRTELRHGLSADLFQVAAILDFQALHPAYKNFTLDRVHERTLGKPGDGDPE